ncbi:MAG TPA: DUF899 family protein [Lacipirellulaceae bacterium]|jgi:predicted dithiol-disulfide oxidoreductase (DUF899 family)
MLTEHQVVSHEEWTAARKQLLQDEKDLTHRRDELSRRRELPWERVEKQYVFDTPGGKRSLAELFDGRSQLIVYHFMLGPDWEEGCHGCSFVSDHFDGSLPHIRARDVTLVAVSRAPLAKIQAFKKRMGWRVPWVSSHGCDFNRDYQVSFSKEDQAGGKVYYNYEMQEFPSDEAPGISVFCRDAGGNVFHTYSSLRARARSVDRRLQPARSGTQGPRRGKPRIPDGLGAPLRSLRGEPTGRTSIAIQRAAAGRLLL